MDFINFKSGYVSIIGKPNVWKSTFLNRLIGEKLSIVSPKPQTTRMQIKGFLNNDHSQIVFLDTPGYIEPRYALQVKMLKYLVESIRSCDASIFICDGTSFPTDYDEKVIQLIQSIQSNNICLINKADLMTDSEISYCQNMLGEMFEEVYTISALEDENFDAVIDGLLSFLPYAPPMYSMEDLSDLPVRFFTQEIIREKIFLGYSEEIPYCSTVVVEKFIEEEGRDYIHANIWIERESQKKILIGQDGRKIGELRRRAEKDIAHMTGKKAVLNLWVKVKRDWRHKKGALHEFGYK